MRGDTLDYDALLVAVGATPDVAVPGALTFSGPRDVAAFSALLDDLDAGRVQRVAFALPASATWALPLYELALMTGEHVRAKGLADVGLILVTPEHAPLEAFGPRIASHIWSLLAERGIAVRASVPLRAGPGGLARAHGEPVQVERIVSLPRSSGRDRRAAARRARLPGHRRARRRARGRRGLGRRRRHGLPPQTGRPRRTAGRCGSDGNCRIRSGADVRPRALPPRPAQHPARPAGPRFLDASARRPAHDAAVVPPTKVAARHLVSYLAPGAPDVPAGSEEIDVGDLLLAPRRAPRDPRRARAGAALPRRSAPGPRRPAARRGGAPRAAGRRARRELIGRRGPDEPEPREARQTGAIAWFERALRGLLRFSSAALDVHP